MQLLLKRNQSVAPTGYIRFDLWAKFDVTSEENALIDKYGVYQAILSEGHTRRDLIRAFIFGVLLTVVMYAVIRYINPQTDMGAVIGIFALAVTFFGGTYYIYHQIRELVYVSDILEGRKFTCRSVLKLLEKEQTITNMALAFRRLLELMQTWGGEEMIDIDTHRGLALVHSEERRHEAA